MIRDMPPLEDYFSGEAHFQFRKKFTFKSVTPQNILFDFTDQSLIQSSWLNCRTLLIWGKTWVNNHAHVLQGKNGVSTEQLMLFIQNKNIAAYITGAVQLKLNQGNMNRIPFIDAGKKLNDVFYSLIKPSYEKIRETIEENQSLTSVRDLLLPKLLSGEITLDSTQSTAEAVA